MGTAVVDAAPVAASSQRLAAVRKLAARWDGERSAMALLRANDLRVLPRTGQSASLLFVQDSSDWIAKLTFESKDAVDDRAAVEEFVARHLVAFAEQVPFVMHCVASHTLLDVMPLLGPKLREGARRLPRATTETIRSHPAGYLVLSERGKGVTMSDFVKWVIKPHLDRPSEHRPTMEDFEAVSLQLVYCTAAFERLGVAHNDLHLDNILVEHLSSAVQFTLRDRPGGASETGFELCLPPTRWMCKVFDWDMASIGSMPREARAPANKALDLYFPPNACTHAGLCGQPGRDLAMVAFNVWQELEGFRGGEHATKAAIAKDWWLKLVPRLDSFLRAAPNDLVHPGYPCYTQPAKGVAKSTLCRPIRTPSAVSVLRRYRPQKWWWRVGSVAVHPCTLPLQTLASRLGRRRAG